MKNVLITIMAAAGLLGLAACSDNLPTVKVHNENTVKANVSFKPDSGSTVNINDVAAGATSAAQTIPEGDIRVTVAMNSGNSPADTTFSAVKNKTYVAVISSDAAPTLTIETE
jgi:hypothetical protein